MCLLCKSFSINVAPVLPTCTFGINKCTGTSVFIFNAFSAVSWAQNSFCPFLPSVFLIFRSGITPHENKETVLSKACQRRWVLPCGIQSFNGSVGSELFFSLSCPKSFHHSRIYFTSTLLCLLGPSPVPLMSETQTWCGSSSCSPALAQSSSGPLILTQTKQNPEHLPGPPLH